MCQVSRQSTSFALNTIDSRHPFYSTVLAQPLTLYWWLLAKLRFSLSRLSVSLLSPPPLPPYLVQHTNRDPASYHSTNRTVFPSACFPSQFAHSEIDKIGTIASSWFQWLPISSTRHSFIPTLQQKSHGNSIPLYTCPTAPTTLASQRIHRLMYALVPGLLPLFAPVTKQQLLQRKSPIPFLGTKQQNPS